MIPKEWLRKIRHIEMRTLRLVENLMAGHYHSVFKGRGMDFDEVRPYEPGDDVKRIDWNVTARTGVVHIKKYIEERELTVLLVVDLSASGGTGSVDQSKRERAAEVAALLAFSAIFNNDKVGLLLFTDKTERYMRPQKGRQHVLSMISLILTHQPRSRGTNLKAALHHAYHAHSRRAVIFLLSDFLDTDYQRALKIVGRKHDLIAVPIYDPSERELPDVGWIIFEDAETGELVELNTGDEAVRSAFAQKAENRLQEMRQTIRQAGVDSIEVSTTGAYLLAFTKFFKTRYHRLHP